MRKIAFLSVVFGILLMLFGCEKEPNVTPETPYFMLTVSPKNGEAEVGEKISITIRTAGGDSITFKTQEIVSVRSYNRPAGLAGVWEVIDTLYINEAGLNQALVEVFELHVLDGEYPVVKYGYSNIIGHFPEINVSANPPQVSWRTSSDINIATAYGDSLVTDLPGVDGLLNGTFPTPLLDSTTTYHFALYSKRNNVTLRNITINVDSPTKEDTLCLKPWKRIRDQHSLDINNPGEDVDISGLCFQDDRRIFNQDGNSILDYGENLCDGQTNRFFYGDWLISTDGTILYTGVNPQFRENTLITLNDTMMVWRYESIYILDDGISWVPMWVTETFIHPQ